MKQVRGFFFLYTLKVADADECVIKQDESYFLNSSRSKVRPSSVFFRDSLRVSMHSFSLGSAVLSPVALSA